MAYELLLYYNFTGRTNTHYRVEILQDVPGPGIPYPVNVKSGNEKFIIEYPSTSNLFEPVRGSGCRFNLVSTSDRMFLSLYTANMMEYKIKVFQTIQITPIYTQDILIWTGYLDSEFYEENFSRKSNYIVSFSGNDGLNLLDRINYVNIDGTHYTEIQTLKDVLKNCISKLNIDYNNIYIGLSTTSNEVPIEEGETILDRVYISSDNFYNEDGEPETCRTVLETILQPFGGIIFQDNGYLYITDINYIASAVTVKDFIVYDNNFNYLLTKSTNIFIGDILNSIDVASNNQKYGVISGINKQVVNYSKYRNINFFNYDSTKDEFSISGSTYNLGDGEYTSVETDYSGSTIWNRFNNGKFRKIKGTGESNLDSFDQYLKIEPYNTDWTISPERLSFTLKSKLPYLISSDKYKIKLQMKVHPQTSQQYTFKADPYNSFELPEEVKLTEVRLHADIRIVDEKLGKTFKYVSYFDVGDSTLKNAWDTPNGANSSIWFNNWTNNPVEGLVRQLINDVDVNLCFQFSKKDYLINLNKFINKNQPIPPTTTATAFSGYIYLDIYDYLFVKNGVNEHLFTTSENYPCSLWIKSINMSIVDENGNAISDTDIEYVADPSNSYLNSLYKTNGETIKTLLGTNYDKYPIERANLLKYYLAGSTPGSTEAYIPIGNFTKNGTTDIIEKLLLRSIISVYGKQKNQISLDVLKLNQLLGYITYQDYIEDKVFMINGIIRNLGSGIDEITIEEINTDDANII